MVTRAIATAAIAVLLATPAAADELPSWKIADICSADSAPGQCRMFEGRARNAVSSSWDVLPPDVQSTCVAAARSAAVRSWRELAGCIELETLRAKRERAIATRSTPAEPEPPAEASSEPAADAPALTEPATPVAPPVVSTEPAKSE